jgi:hypothetical protein
VYGAEFLLDGGDEDIALDKVILMAGQNLIVGTVLGKITASGKYTAYDPAANDGSQKAVAILRDSTDASLGDTPCVVVSRLAEVFDGKLIYAQGISAANKTAAIASLATANIIVRT